MEIKVKNVIYSNEQIQNILNFLNHITITGIQQAKFLGAVGDILEHPVDVIPEESQDTESDSPKDRNQ